MSENFIWQIEKGQREPSDRTISDICRVYGINETWLREGAGAMYVPKTREETIAELVGSALNGSSDFKKAVIQMICSRTDQELETLEAALRSIYESLCPQSKAPTVIPWGSSYSFFTIPFINASSSRSSLTVIPFAASRISPRSLCRSSILFVLLCKKFVECFVYFATFLDLRYFV